MLHPYHIYMTLQTYSSIIPHTHYQRVKSLEWICKKLSFSVLVSLLFPVLLNHNVDHRDDKWVLTLDWTALQMGWECDYGATVSQCLSHTSSFQINSQVEVMHDADPCYTVISMQIQKCIKYNSLRYFCYCIFIHFFI